MEPGDVAIMPLPDGAFGACQVVAVQDKGNDVVACALDWHSPRPPRLDDLRDAGPLMATHHLHDGRPEMLHVLDNTAPPGFTWIGRLPLRGDVSEDTHSYGGWGALPIDVVLQHRWNALPQQVRDAYKASGTFRGFTIDLGHGLIDVHNRTSRLDLTGTKPLDWTPLHELPHLTEIRWAGPDDGLTGALAGLPLITSLIWEDAPPTVDLSRTGLHSLTIGGATELHLPPTLMRLTLAGTPVVHYAGPRLSLTLIRGAAAPKGIGEVVHQAVLTTDGVATATALDGLTELQDLTIRWQKAPGRLDDAEILGTLPRLEHLNLIDGYDVDPTALPELPALRVVDISGLRREHLPAWKSKSKDIRLFTYGPKSSAWLEANLDNPFRDWADDDERAGNAACKAYAKALRAITKTPADAEQILHALIDALNRLDGRNGFDIDTIRREEACEAAISLAVRAGVGEQTAESWIDDWRDF